ncbi:MAG: thiamine pyrophosphate-dependent enzyme, partial [Pseudomonadota bacterium]|nr:thiamine pyrophosphate-dependent enzyme [Pseudomonadota bacterium]
APCAPVYVNFDAHMQEAALEAPLPPIDPARYRPYVASMPGTAQLDAAIDLLAGASDPLILAGRASRDEGAWRLRVELAERLGARVLTDLKVGAAFPTDHALHAAPPSVLTSADIAAAIALSDVVLSLDWVDLAGTLSVAFQGEARAKVIHASLDHTLHNGWSMDHQGLPPVDVMLASDPDAAVTLLLERLRMRTRAARVFGTSPGSDLRSDAPRPDSAAAVAVGDKPAAAQSEDKPDTVALARALREAVGDRAVSLAHLPLSWDGASWPFRHPLDYLGSDGGGGIGAGPGIAVGAALALRGTGRLPIAVCGDGDYLMGVTALWTATHYGIPLLLVVANNNSFYNDEVHQERMARMRDRPVENKWIGQRIDDPAIDLAAMAQAQGAFAIGPVTRLAELREAFTRAIAAVDEGRVAVVDVRIATGYTPSMSAALTPGKVR